MKKIRAIFLVFLFATLSIACNETKTTELPPTKDKTISNVMELTTEVRNGCEIKYHFKKNNDDYYLFVEDETFEKVYDVKNFISSDNVIDIQNNNSTLALGENLITVQDNIIIFSNRDQINYHIRNRKEYVYSGCNGFEEQSTLAVFGKELHPGDIVDLSTLKILNSVKSILINPEYKIYINNCIALNEIYSCSDRIVLCDYCILLTSITETDNIRDIEFNINYNNDIFNVTIKKTTTRITIGEKSWLDISQLKNISFNITNSKYLEIKDTKIFNSSGECYGILTTVVNGRNFYCRFLCRGYSISSFTSNEFYFENVNNFDFFQLNGQTLVFENSEEGE